MSTTTSTFTTTTTSSSTTSSTTSTSISTTSSSSTSSTTHSSSSTTTTAPDAGFLLTRQVTIPQNSRIMRAVVEFTGYAPIDGIDTDVQCHFENADNPSAPSDKADLDTRELTDGVVWEDIEEWRDNYIYQTPQLRDILQQVISRSGWVSGNNILFIAKNAGLGSYRLWSAIEHSGGSEAARLRVSWIAPRKLAPPVITPAETFQLGVFECTIHAYPTDADIYYTIDGSNPNENDILYSGPFMIIESMEIRARAYKEYWTYSDIASISYFFYNAPAETEQFSPDGFDVGGLFSAVEGSGTLLLVGTAGSGDIYSAGTYVLSKNVGGSTTVLQKDSDDSLNVYCLKRVAGVHHLLCQLNASGYPYKYINDTDSEFITNFYSSTGTEWSPGGEIFIDGSGYAHIFLFGDQIYDGYFNRVCYVTNSTGSWTYELLYQHTNSFLAAVELSDGSYVVGVSAATDFTIIEGVSGSWDTSIVSGSLGTNTSFRAYVDDSDNVYFAYISGGDLYILDNEGGSWSFSNVVTLPPGSSRLRGFKKDSNGYFHIALMVSAVYREVWYVSNRSGSWAFTQVSEAGSSHDRLSFNGLNLNLAEDEVYIVWEAIGEDVLYNATISI